MSQSHVQEHIDLIAKHEQDFLVRRTPAEKLGDSIAGIAGSLSFVCIHLFLFAGWIMMNTFSVAHIRHFDPKPYSLLGTLVALEAILLASIILMRQSRMSRRAEERDHLMLQILLLTEREITAVLGMERQVAGRVGLKKIANDQEIEQLSQHTSIDDVAQTIKDSLPSE
ncbi:MAG: DUF1003 domain-containing protein [Silvibacterium sp.]